MNPISAPLASCRRPLAALLALTLFAGPLPLRAASTVTSSLFMEQGSGSGTSDGDYVSDANGLDTYYSYFVEVPSGLSRLVIDVYDPDIGLGGAAESNSQRDRARSTFNSAAAYSLRAPDGSTRPVGFGTGNTTTPAGSDGAWTNLFDSTNDTLRDNFSTASYSNNDGNLSFSTNWIETNDDGSPTNTRGNIVITGGELRIQDDGGGASTIERQANLLGSGSATLSFNLRTQNVEGTDQMAVDVSSNGGTSWTRLETFTGAFATGTSRSYDISSYISSNTRVRFIEVSGYTGTDSFYVDNFQIQESNISIPAGHWEVRVDMSSAVTGGDDINGIGLRAHDGDSSSGGTELPVYVDSIASLGVNPPASGTNSRSYTLYPWITSGCTAISNDFDYDINQGASGSIAFSSRTGAYTQTIASASLSGNNSWDSNPNTISRWTSDQSATEYGIWEQDVTIDSYLVNGVPNGNYTDIYVANSQATANPPTANPVPNSFRIYLPTDAGAAPVKPYVEQLLTFKSGTNPPAVGQTARYQVTVRVVNPTAQAITFSSSNLVTANVPGSGAVYAGNAAVGQGTIVSQPSVGGTGNITWNPGTLAAGATSILTYQVDVTPTSSGQRIPVTGTPSSNGTTARYVDETGNTTQSRATYTFGPLCELAVTQNLLTQAVVSGFRASPADGGGVLLEWRTASEAGTAGFYVQRWDAGARRWTRVNRELLAGLQAPQGGVYRFVDEGASPGEPRLYRLQEIEAGGHSRIYGPFAAAVDWSRPDPRRSGAAYERIARRAPGRGDATELAKVREAGIVAAVKNGVHLSVRQTGLYELRAADLAAWLGETPEKVGTMIAKGKLALTRGGQPVAWYPDLAAGGKAKDPAKGSAQGLFFYGEAPPPGSVYSDASVYRLQKTDGLLMQTVSAGVANAPGNAAAAPPAPPGGNGATFPETLHVERDLFAATVLPLDPESDYWFWDFLQGNDPTYGHRAYTLDAPGLTGTGGSLTVSLQGATASGVTEEHRVTVTLNGTALGETRWTGITARQATFAIPPGVLRETGNQVELTAQTGDGAPYSIFYLNSFDLSYPRAFRAAGNVLAFTPGGNPHVTVGGFSNAGGLLLDVQDPLHPRWIAGAATGPDGASGYQVSFNPSSQGRYLAATKDAVLAPAAVRAWSSPSLRRPGNRAAYLVIAAAGLHDAAERLADLRRAQGMEAMVVDLDQVMDEFSAGVPNPHAIHDFLAYARGNWSVAPQYVTLAGAGTVDYRNLLGYGDDLVPPLMVQSDGGLFPSDNLLGDVDGDGLPEMAVGRLPVVSAAELDAYTAKLAAYEGAAPADWTGTAVMAADAPDHATDFSADSRQVAGQIPPLYRLSQVDLGASTLADARAQLLGAIGQGTAFVNYMGHGGLDRLSSGGLLTNADVPNLANGGRLPVMTAMTCTINRFAVPGVPSLGELLVKSGAGGAAAVWGPTGLSANGQARLLAERFYHAADARLGDRVLRAVAEFRALGGDPALPRVYDILGDPALRLQTPPAPAVTGGETGE